MDADDRDDVVFLAGALAGDPERAALLVSETETALHREEAGDPVEVLLRLYLRDAAPPPPVPDPPPHLPPELLPGWAALGTVTGLPRAALVLDRRYPRGTELSALALGRPVGLVVEALHTAERTLGGAAGSAGHLLDLLPRPDATAQAAARSALRRRGRRRTGRVLLAAVLAVGLLAGVTVLPGLVDGRGQRGYGEWAYGFSLVPSTGWQAQGHTLRAGTDAVDVRRSDRSERGCTVTVTTGRGRLPTPDGRRLDLADGTGGRVVDGPEGGPALWWRQASRTTASVACPAGTTDATLREVAGLVRVARAPALTPIGLADLPPDRQVVSLNELFNTVSAVVAPRDGSADSPEAVVVALNGPSGELVANPFTESLPRDGTPRLQLTRENGSACWRPSRAVTACVYGSTTARTEAGREALGARLSTLVGLVRVAPDLGDRSTWFDAADALPR